MEIGRRTLACGGVDVQTAAFAHTARAPATISFTDHATVANVCVIGRVQGRYAYTKQYRTRSLRGTRPRNTDVMAIPRNQLVDPVIPLFYHLISRCVRRCWLCGYDKVTRKNYGHRKQWLIERMKFLSRYFAIELHAYSVMSNHFHLVVYYDPLASLSWTDEEVVDRWLAVCPPRKCRGKSDPNTVFLYKQSLLLDPMRVSHLRAELGSLSTFMKLLKQPIARRANIEDDVKGHFFEQRFYSGALLSERSVQSAMAYVDLNAVEAMIASSIDEIEDASIEERLAAIESDPDLLEAFLAPLESGLADRSRTVSISLQDYIVILRLRCPRSGKVEPGSREARWLQDIASLGDMQRAYGTYDLLKEWFGKRHWKLPESAASN